MTKQEFYAGVHFEVGDGYEYRFRESYSETGLGGLVRRLIGQHEWRHCANIQTANPRGVRVFEYWVGKRVSRFLFFSKLNPHPAKDLADKTDSR